MQDTHPLPWPAQKSLSVKHSEISESSYSGCVKKEEIPLMSWLLLTQKGIIIKYNLILFIVLLLTYTEVHFLKKSYILFICFVQQSYISLLFRTKSYLSYFFVQKSNISYFLVQKSSKK